MQNTDIEGELVNSILNASRKLNCQCCGMTRQPAIDQFKSKEEFYGIGGISGTLENSTIILEIMKYYGRDINLVEAF